MAFLWITSVGLEHTTSDTSDSKRNFSSIGLQRSRCTTRTGFSATIPVTEAITNADWNGSATTEARSDNDEKWKGFTTAGPIPWQPALG